MAKVVVYTKEVTCNMADGGTIYTMKADGKVIGWAVESANNPFGYQINVAGQCSCPGYGYRGDCKHAKALANVVRFEGRKEGAA